jgi:ferredoxin-nitrite reductase
MPVEPTRLVSPFRRTGRLSALERSKLERHPLDVLADVVDVYAAGGPSAVDAVPGEWERLKWAGLYPQRQGPDRLMLRIKVPGGRLRADQARVVGALAGRFARPPEGGGASVVDITTRQDLQLHWIAFADVPEIWETLGSVGLTTHQACGDGPRNVTCCPVSGIDAEEVVGALGVAEALSAHFSGRRSTANLPRKLKIAVSGCVEDCVRAEINDIALVPAEPPSGAPGFNLLVGGGLSDGPRLASDLDVFVAPDEAVEVVSGVVALFAELGNREHRGMARLKYLVEELGPEGFRAALARRLGRALPSAGRSLTKRWRSDHVGVHQDVRPGRVLVGLAVAAGRLRGEDLTELAELAERLGDGELRLTTDQGVVLSGVDEARLEELRVAPVVQRHPFAPGPFRRGVMACTGTEFCRFALVETKARAVALARALDGWLVAEGLSEIVGDEAVRVHLSGCPASCAQPQIADIGLRGTLRTEEAGMAEAVDVGLGGGLGPDARFVRWAAGSLPLERLEEAIAGLVRAWVDAPDGRAAQRAAAEPGLPFGAWLRRRARDAEVIEVLARAGGLTEAGARDGGVEHDAH